MCAKVSGFTGNRRRRPKPRPVAERGRRPDALKRLDSCRPLRVHHVAHFIEDVEADVEHARKQEFERLCSMRDKGGFRYFYLQSTTMPEVWIEFLEVSPMLREIFANGIDEAARWDGSNPIRRIEYRDL